MRISNEGETPGEPQELVTQPIRSSELPRRRPWGVIIAWGVAVVALAAAITLLVVQVNTAGTLDHTRAALAETEERVKELSAEGEELSRNLEGARSDLDEAVAGNDRLQARNKELGQSLRGCRSFFRRSALAFERFGPLGSAEQYEQVLGATAFNELLSCFGGKLPGFL